MTWTKEIPKQDGKYLLFRPSEGQTEVFEFDYGRLWPCSQLFKLVAFRFRHRREDWWTGPIEYPNPYEIPEIRAEAGWDKVRRRRTKKGATK